jgi:hypothetical protein
MRFSTIAICLCTVVFTASAQTAGKPADAQSELVQKLLQRIDTLEKRVAGLEAKQSAASPSAAAAAEPSAEASPPAAAVPSAVPVPAAMPTAAVDHDATMPVDADTYPSLHLRGFADVGFSATDRKGTNTGFNLGQFVLHIASPLSKKVSYFAEVSLTAQPTGYNVDLERTIIRYDYNDRLRVSFGRYHTPVDYWNTAFHHGSWLQTTISRPDMIAFGGQFLPTHFIGGLAEGDLPTGGANVGYAVGIGNGRGSIISRAGDAGDANNHPAWVAEVFSRPSVVRGLQVGGSIYRDDITPSTGGSFGEWIASGHVILTRETPELLAEFSNVHHRNNLTGRTFDSQGFYTQIAYRLPLYDKHFKPYFRYDYIQVPFGEQVFTTVNNQRGSTAGLRYDISEFAAFKAEYRDQSPFKPQRDRAHGLFLQTSFTF